MVNNHSTLASTFHHYIQATLLWHFKIYLTADKFQFPMSLHFSNLKQHRLCEQSDMESRKFRVEKYHLPCSQSSINARKADSRNQKEYKKEVTFTESVCATIPSTVLSVKGSKFLSGLLINSGFSLQPHFPLYSYMPRFSCMARSVKQHTRAMSHAIFPAGLLTYSHKLCSYLE